MTKVNPHIEQGVGYVRISRLPFNQAIGIRRSIPQISMVSLKTADGIVSDAIEYSQYEYWFDFQHFSIESDFDI